VKRQGRCGHIEGCRDVARGQTFWTLPHEKPEHRQPGVLGETSNHLNCELNFHISKTIKISRKSQAAMG
jgi:hypothetical protein